MQQWVLESEKGRAKRDGVRQHECEKEYVPSYIPSQMTNIRSYTLNNHPTQFITSSPLLIYGPHNCLVLDLDICSPETLPLLSPFKKEGGGGRRRTHD